MAKIVFEGEVLHTFTYDAGYESLMYPPNTERFNQEDMIQQILKLIPEDNKPHTIKITVELPDDAKTTT